MAHGSDRTLDPRVKVKPMDAPTLVLVPILTAFILFAAVRAAALVRTFLRDGGRASVSEEDADRIALEDEKHRILTTIKDLEHEHQLGKLSDADYDGLRSFYEREAVRVIDALEVK